MDIRTREELKKEIQKFSNNEKLVLGDSSFNVCVNRKFLFPYNQLDIVRDVLADTVKDFTIYFCIFREICASVPKERSAIPLETEQRSVGN